MIASRCSRHCSAPAVLGDAPQAIRANLTLRSTALRHAVRLAGTVAVADALQRALQLPHGYWVIAGQAPGYYHAESELEGFLVLSGECVAVLEGQERRLRQWDYLHCPPGTEHITVGAGPEPCAILMFGTRDPDRKIHYAVDRTAARYGASVTRASDSAAEVYAKPAAGRSRPGAGAVLLAGMAGRRSRRGIERAALHGGGFGNVAWTITGWPWPVKATSHTHAGTPALSADDDRDTGLGRSEPDIHRDGQGMVGSGGG